MSSTPAVPAIPSLYQLRVVLHGISPLIWRRDGCFVTWGNFGTMWVHRRISLGVYPCIKATARPLNSTRSELETPVQWVRGAVPGLISTATRENTIFKD
jgi:hypothetical protein